MPRRRREWVKTWDEPGVRRPKRHSMGALCIALIVAGCLVLVISVAFGVGFCYMKRNRSPTAAPRKFDTELGVASAAAAHSEQ